MYRPCSGSGEGKGQQNPPSGNSRRGQVHADTDQHGAGHRPNVSGIVSVTHSGLGPQSKGLSFLLGS